MKKITLFLLLCVSAVQAQNFEWLQTPEITFSLNPDGISYPITTDVSGNVYMAGYKENPVPYNDVMGTVFYNKYDHDGSLLFSKTIGGEATVYEMATDSEGNLLMAAGYTTSISFGSFTLLTVNQGVQFLMLKFSPQGNLLWYQPIEIEDSFVNDFRTIVTDADNNIYIGYDDYNHSYISKLNSDGATQLVITQEYAKMVTSISVDNAGNIYAAGACAESIATYGGVAAGSPFGYNTFAVKYSPSGAFQWIKYVEDVTCPFPQIKARTPDAVYFSSYLYGPFQFDGITAEGPNDFGNTDFFLAKLNSAGQYQWVREVYGNSGFVIPGKKNFLELDNSGNVYFAGSYKGTVNWGNDIVTTNISYTDDALLLKYDTDGNVVAAITAGGIDQDRTDSVRVAADGSVFLSGVVNGDIACGDLTHSSPGYQFYPFLTKISSAPLGTPDTHDVKLTLYPNPAADVVHFSGDKGMTGTVWNMIGQQVKTFSVAAGQALDVSELSQGSYVVKADGMVFKFVKK